MCVCVIYAETPSYITPTTICLVDLLPVFLSEKERRSNNIFHVHLSYAYRLREEVKGEPRVNLDGDSDTRASSRGLCVNKKYAIRQRF